MPPPINAWGDPGGQPIILIHGLTGRGLIWLDVAERLAAAGNYVLAPDLAGHGGHHPPDHSLAAMAGEIFTLLDQQGGPAAIVGHSLGAIVGWQVALDRPQQVQSLVLEDQPPDRRASSVQGWRDWAGAWPQHFSSRAEAMEFLVNAGRSMAWWKPSLELKPDGTWGWGFDFAAVTDIAGELADLDSWADLKRLKVPTLIIRGADSPHLKPEVAARMNQVIPNSHLVTVPDADHWVHRNAEVYSKILIDFWAKTKNIDLRRRAGRC